MAGTRSINLLEYADRTGLIETPEVTNHTASGAHFVVDIKTMSIGQGLVLDVYGLSHDNVRYRIFRSLPMVEAQTYRYVIGPAFECVPGIACRDFMPRRFLMEIEPDIPGQTDNYAVSVELSAS